MCFLYRAVCSLHNEKWVFPKWSLGCACHLDAELFQRTNPAPLAPPAGWQGLSGREGCCGAA